MRKFKTEHQERATAILEAVKGLSIAVAQWQSAAFLRHDMKRKRKAQGLSTDLKSLIAKYRLICPEYADALEKIIYPSPKITSD